MKLDKQEPHENPTVGAHPHGVTSDGSSTAVATQEGAPTQQASHADGLPAILREARQAVSRCDADLRQLRTVIRTMRSAAERDQAQLQRFLEEFALEQAIHLPRSTAESRADGPVIDVDAICSEQETMVSRIDRAMAVTANLVAASRLLSAVSELLGDDHAYQAVQDSDNVQLQQGMNEAREGERRRLAREIHDGPAQTLANVLFAVEMAEQVSTRHPEQVPDELRRARKQIKDGLAEIRRFMFELRPAALRDLGLIRSLTHYVQEYNECFQIDVGFSAEGPLPSLSEEQELTIFRITQEALQNVRKHSGAARASVTLRSAAARVELTVSDDGAGFEPDKVVARSSTGAGLPGMRERAKLIGATLAIRSRPTTGTHVELVVTA